VGCTRHLAWAAIRFDLQGDHVEPLEFEGTSDDGLIASTGAETRHVSAQVTPDCQIQLWFREGELQPPWPRAIRSSVRLACTSGPLCYVDPGGTHLENRPVTVDAWTDARRLSGTFGATLDYDACALPEPEEPDVLRYGVENGSFEIVFEPAP